MAKATIATVKSFIRNNKGKIFINLKSSFDGMTDGVESIPNARFLPAKETTDHQEHSFGIDGAWFVGQSRDYITPYEDDNYRGFDIYNSCGRFILATKK